MRLSNREQTGMQYIVFDAFADAIYRGHFRAWSAIVDFDRHSPCKNIMFTTPKGSEIKVFLPNSTVEDLYNEQYNTIGVWFNVYGVGEADEPEYFNNEEVLIDYLIENTENL